MVVAQQVLHELPAWLATVQAATVKKCESVRSAQYHELEMKDSWGSRPKEDAKLLKFAMFFTFKYGTQPTRSHSHSTPSLRGEAHCAGQPDLRFDRQNSRRRGPCLHGHLPRCTV